MLPPGLSGHGGVCGIEDPRQGFPHAEQELNHVSCFPLAPIFVFFFCFVRIRALKGVDLPKDTPGDNGMVCDKPFLRFFPKDLSFFSLSLFFMVIFWFRFWASKRHLGGA